jgi:hypothetical protein
MLPPQRRPEHGLTAAPVATEFPGISLKAIRKSHFQSTGLSIQARMIVYEYIIKTISKKSGI